MIWAWSTLRRTFALLPPLAVWLLLSAANAQGIDRAAGARIHGSVDAFGRLSRLAGDSIGVEPGQSTYLEPNVPNPFTLSTLIAYSLATETSVILTVYDFFYGEVTTLVNNKTQAPGRYEVSFTPASLASGMYFYTLRTREGIEQRRMLYIK